MLFSRITGLVFATTSLAFEFPGDAYNSQTKQLVSRHHGLPVPVYNYRPSFIDSGVATPPPVGANSHSRPNPNEVTPSPVTEDITTKPLDFDPALVERSITEVMKVYYRATETSAEAAAAKAETGSKIDTQSTGTLPLEYIKSHISERYQRLFESDTSRIRDALILVAQANYQQYLKKALGGWDILRSLGTLAEDFQKCTVAAGDGKPPSVRGTGSHSEAEKCIEAFEGRFARFATLNVQILLEPVEEASQLHEFWGPSKSGSASNGKSQR